MGGRAPIVDSPVIATEKLTGTERADRYLLQPRHSFDAGAGQVARAIRWCQSGGLNKALSDRKGRARARLSGELPTGVLSQLDRLADGGSANGACHAALYELTDQVLIDRLLAAKKRLHIVSRTTPATRRTGYDSANKPARDQLARSGAELISRYLPDGRSIGHNKFMVYSEGDQPCPC